MDPSSTRATRSPATGSDATWPVPAGQSRPGVNPARGYGGRGVAFHYVSVTVLIHRRRPPSPKLRGRVIVAATSPGQSPSVVSIPSRFRGRARRDAAAFYLSQLARGILAGELGVLVGNETVPVRADRLPAARDRRHPEIACEPRLGARPLAAAQPGSRRRRPAREARLARPVTRTGSPRIYSAVIRTQPRGARLVSRCEASGDTQRDDGASGRTRVSAGAPTARVLVAEDERDVAELIRYTLAREGFEVVVATNGADALRQAREGRPDLVLLDLMLPAGERVGAVPAAQAGPGHPRAARDHAHRSGRGRRQGPRLRAGGGRLRDEAVLHARAGRPGPRRRPADPARRGRGAAAPDQGRRPRGGPPAVRGHGGRARGRAHAEGVRAARDARRRAGPRVRSRRAARSRVGPGRLRRAPHRRRSPRASPGEVPGGAPPGARHRDRPGRRIPLPGIRPAAPRNADVTWPQPDRHAHHQPWHNEMEEGHA